MHQLSITVPREKSSVSTAMRSTLDTEQNRSTRDGWTQRQLWEIREKWTHVPDVLEKFLKLKNVQQKLDPSTPTVSHALSVPESSIRSHVVRVRMERYIAKHAMHTTLDLNQDLDPEPKLLDLGQRTLQNFTIMKMTCLPAQL